MQPVRVQIPAMLRHECGGARNVFVAAETVQEALIALQDKQPRLYQCICDETGAVRQHIHLFLGDELLHQTRGLTEKLPPGAIVSVMPAVSGG